MSFKDSNGDGKGDLAGILEKIDYLNDGSNDSLGINAVWICPFFKSPMKDFGYDVSDYKNIDPTFGDIKIFKKLTGELHKRNIKVIIDFVGNHTSSEHEWFKESRSSRVNPKRDWYVWHDKALDGGPPNNWHSLFNGSAWELDEKTGQYYLHSFFKEQPDLNWRNKEVREAMMDVIDFWVAEGVDGFRIDALQNFLEDKLYRDDPINKKFDGDKADYNSLLHTNSIGDAERMAVFGRFMERAFGKYPDLFLIGEVYTDVKNLKWLYELSKTGRFMPFNFSLINQEWNASSYKKTIDEYQSLLLDDHLPNYTIGNHDVNRVSTRLGEPAARLSAFLQFTLPGMPFIYYGDEIGMINGTVQTHETKDPLAKSHKLSSNPNPGRDFERTPMQWNGSPYAGFGDGSGFAAGKPWLPVSSNYREVNVETEQEESGSFLALYKSLIRTRLKSPVLKYGKYIPRHSNSPSIFSFERHLDGERLLVLANFSDSHIREVLQRESSVIFNTTSYGNIHTSSKIIELAPYEGCVIRL